MVLDKSSFFLLGIKGVAMTNIAIILQQMGKGVTGVDVEDEFITDETLKNNLIQYTTDFADFSKIINSDVFIYSGAHGGLHNPLAVEAKKLGKLVVSQAELVGEITRQFQTSIAVAGCHGKTTTSSLLTYALQNLKKNPSYLVGVPEYQGTGGGKYTKSSYFVIEADEYAVDPPRDKTPKLLYLYPDIALCLNIDFDHPDVYASLEDTKKTFLTFFSQTKKLVLCKDDPVIRSLLTSISNASVTTYGSTSDCDYQFSSVENGFTSTFTVLQKRRILGRITTSLFGEKNVLNTLGVIVVLLQLGYTFQDVAQAVQDFQGVKRRSELLWTDKNSFVFDDYGHHPAEIQATITALKVRFPKKKLHVLFQPHTFSRTRVLKNEFGQALSLADYAYIAPIFSSAREKQTNDISSFDIVESTNVQSIRAFYSKKDMIAALGASFCSGDVVLTIGAGDIYKLKDDIIKIITDGKQINTNISSRRIRER